MNIQSSTHNYFRTASHATHGHQTAKVGILPLFTDLVVLRKAIKVLLCMLPLILGINLWLASHISSQEAIALQVNEAIVAVKKSNVELQGSRDTLYEPESIKIAAAEKLLLFEAGPGQIIKM